MQYCSACVATTLTLVFTVYVGVLLVTMIFLGSMSDYVGRRWVIITGLTAGPGTFFHAAPVQCRYRFCSPSEPTAHASLRESADTATRSADPAGLGAGTVFQAPPLSRRISS
jgi:MFS family permease